MSRIRTLAIPAALLAAVAAAWWWWSNHDIGSDSKASQRTDQAGRADPAPPPRQDLAPPTLALPEGLLAGQAQPDVRERIRSRKVGTQPLFPDDKSLAQARQQMVLFSTGLAAHAAAQSPLANERRLQDGRQWISYDMQVLAARAEGDRFILPVPGESATEAEIDLVETGTGTLQWSGRLLGMGGGTFHITQHFADQYAVGSIRTPHGEYLLEVKAGIGWVTDAGKEFVLPPDGKDTVSPTGTHPHRH